MGKREYLTNLLPENKEHGLLWYLSSRLDRKRGADPRSIAPDAVNSHELLQHSRMGRG